MPAIPAWMRLFRPWNAAIAAGAVWLGWASLGFRPEAALALWGSLSMLLLVAAGNADNDALDAAADRINRPERPVASGAIAARTARAAAFSLYAAAVFVAWVGTPVHGALALGMVLLLRFYNLRLKAVPLAGNLAVALLCALAVYFTEFPLLPRDTVPVLLFAFLATFARELVKDAEDAAGDRAAGLRTFPIAAGASAARKLAFALVVLILLLLPVPALWFGYGAGYAAAAVLFAGPLLALLLRELARPAADFHRAQKLLKWLMLAGMAALLAGAITRNV